MPKAADNADAGQDPQEASEDPDTQNLGTGSGATELESLQKLESTHGIECKCASEVSGVELILGKDASCWLLASADKTIDRHTIIGGFGTGQWVSGADSQPGIDFAMPHGDQSIVQLDESTFSSEAQGVSTSSLFKLLTRAERDKGVVDHRVSFLTITRKEDSEVDGGDGFKVVVKTPMKFRCIRDPRGGSEDKVTAKNFFSKSINGLNGDLALKVFRFRFERVGQNFKIQRPYMVAGRALCLKKDKPFKITKD